MTAVNTEPTKLDVLAIFPHPDDAELGVAGTLLKLKSQGYRTGVLDMTRGEMGTRGTVEGRHLEALDAARIMQLDARLNLGLADGNIWCDDESRRKLVRILRACAPQVILTLHWDDTHPDHAHTAQLVREAARLASMRRYDEDAGLEPIKVPLIAFSISTRLVVPSFIVDVTDHAAVKMDAIRAHVSQFYRADTDEPATRISDKNFLAQIEARMGYYGSLIGTAAGEAFYVREALNIDDPVALLTRPMNLYS